MLQSFTSKNDGLGDFGGTARITNGNDAETTGIFTITLFRNGQKIPSLQGSSNGVSPGKTVTVSMISSDPYKAGSFTLDFQTDTSF